MVRGGRVARASKLVSSVLLGAPRSFGALLRQLGRQRAAKTLLLALAPLVLLSMAAPARSTTPLVPRSSYFVASNADDAALLGRLQARLSEHCGGGLVTPSSVEAAAVKELGLAEAPAAVASQRLQAIEDADLVVAELSGATESASVGAEVMYALHKRRIPVLCLWRRGGECGPFASALKAGGLAHPLLTVSEYDDADAAVEQLDAFAAPPAVPGRIFVVEGGDGAGKQTQSAMLRARLEAEGYPVATLDYPHDSALHGKLIRTLLSGAKGDIKALNPLLFASLYAQNRADTAPLLSAWLKRGCNVILDRYVEANFGHQASKLPPAERPDLIRQLAAFEHDWLDLPRAHRVVYLDLPPEAAAKAMAGDASRAALDIHETAGNDYKSAVRDTFLWCAEHHDHWVRVACVDAGGARYSKQELSDVLYSSLASEFVNKREVQK